MEFPSNVILVGIGHKARNGKDSTALILKDMHPNTHIFHWANGVYDEVMNTNGHPLIHSDKDKFYLLDDRTHGHYKSYPKSEFPKLQRMFEVREIKVYDKMRAKDPEMLQFWGTDFRRAKCDPDYWVKKTLQDIEVEALSYSGDLHLVAIADTRFKNEHAAVKEHNGVYVEVKRFNLGDGLVRYICPDRDPEHPSEVDLDDAEADYTLSATDLDGLRDAAKGLLRFLLERG